MTVTANRSPARVRDTPASVVNISSEDLAAAPASPVDEVLRQVPGFTLFRRSGSRTANPTSQGVSLRGVGGSGASRAAVYDDGIPLNDPFGGWVAWGRVPRADLDRVEVVSGGASSLYGGAALAGAIALLRREPAGNSLALDTSYGAQGTPEASASLSGREGPWGAQVAGESFPHGRLHRGARERARAGGHPGQLPPRRGRRDPRPGGGGEGPGLSPRLVLHRVARQRDAAPEERHRHPAARGRRGLAATPRVRVAPRVRHARDLPSDLLLHLGRPQDGDARTITDSSRRTPGESPRNGRARRPPTASSPDWTLAKSKARATRTSSPAGDPPSRGRAASSRRARSSRKTSGRPAPAGA